MPSRTETVRRSQTDAAELAATRRAALVAIDPAAASSASPLSPSDARPSVASFIRPPCFRLCLHSCMPILRTVARTFIAKMRSEIFPKSWIGASKSPLSGLCIQPLLLPTKYILTMPTFARPCSFLLHGEPQKPPPGTADQIGAQTLRYSILS